MCPFPLLLLMSQPVRKVWLLEWMWLIFSSTSDDQSKMEVISSLCCSVNFWLIRGYHSRALLPYWLSRGYRVIFKKKFPTLFFLPVLTFPAFATLKLLRSVVQDSQSMLQASGPPARAQMCSAKSCFFAPPSDGAAPRSWLWPLKTLLVSDGCKHSAFRLLPTHGK